jgi:uncharacterized RDD family membrane protein YckC
MQDLGSGSAFSPIASGPVPPFDLYLQQDLARRRVLYAGFWRRFFAGCVDGILLGIVNLALTFLLTNILQAMSTSQDLGTEVAAWFGIEVIVPTLVCWIYYAGTQSSQQQATIGKAALGIFVTDLDGSRITFWRATGRFVASYLSAFILLIGYLIQPFTRRRQALHDLIAGTLVVLE